MVEPIMGEGGIKVIPDWCLKDLRKICNKKKILLILDEVHHLNADAQAKLLRLIQNRSIV